MEDMFDSRRLLFSRCLSSCYQMEAVRQDEQLEMVGNSVAVLKNMGEQIGNELETQNQYVNVFIDVLACGFERTVF